VTMRKTGHEDEQTVAHRIIEVRSFQIPTTLLWRCAMYRDREEKSGQAAYSEAGSPPGLEPDGLPVVSL
jgi:hypothetical protein